MNKELKKAAEILVACGYAENYWMSNLINLEPIEEKCDPFADTLEGRRQADAIEDWVISNHMELFLRDAPCHVSPNGVNHQWRLDRIKWCLERLTGEDNEQKPNS